MEISNRSNNNLTPNLLGPEVPPTGNSEFGKAWAEIGIGSENRIPALPVFGSRAPFHQDTDTDVETFDRNFILTQVLIWILYVNKTLKFIIVFL